jgi:hypothetical protein
MHSRVWKVVRVASDVINFWFEALRKTMSVPA